MKQKNKRNAVNSTFLPFLTNAADRNRTGTGITTHGILSPGRLPVPPLRQEMLERSDTKIYMLCTTFSDLASMGGGGFEPPKQIAADLQSVPFGHSGIHPFCLSTISIYIINKKKAQGNLSNSPALFPNFYTQNDHAAFI